VTPCVTTLHRREDSPGGPLPFPPVAPLPFPPLLLLECAVLWLRVRRDEAAETAGAHNSATKQITANAEERAIVL